MSTFDAFWLTTALWMLSLAAAGMLLGISSWSGAFTLAVVGVTPILVARHVVDEYEPNLSQSIQRKHR